MYARPFCMVLYLWILDEQRDWMYGWWATCFIQTHGQHNTCSTHCGSLWSERGMIPSPKSWFLGCIARAKNTPGSNPFQTDSKLNADRALHCIAKLQKIPYIKISGVLLWYITVYLYTTTPSSAHRRIQVQRLAKSIQLHKKVMLFTYYYSTVSSYNTQSKMYLHHQGLEMYTVLYLFSSIILCTYSVLLAHWKSSSLGCTPVAFSISHSRDDQKRITSNG